MTDRQTEDAREARAWAAERRFTTTSFGEIAYVDRGRGSVALFLHGFPLNGFQWRNVTARLADVRRCIAPDALGLGHTRVRPGKAVGFVEQAAMLVELMDPLETGPVDVVANDSNTGVAQMLAARHPERVRSLLLTNGDTEPDSPPEALVPMIELGRSGRLADAVLAPNLADAAIARSGEGLGGLAYTDPGNLTDAAREQYLAPLLATSERKALVNAYAAALAPNPLAGIEAELRRVQAPVRVVWGMADVFFSSDAAAYLDRLFPSSRGVHELPDAKLFFPEELPELVAGEARRLWSSA